MIEIPKNPPRHIEIVRFWEPRREFARVFENAPACFACREGKRTWKELERAHIVARSQGGSFWPDNFILLCKQCHHEQPMLTDAALVVEWASSHPHFFDWMGDLVRREREYYGPDFKFDGEDGRRAGIFLREQALRFHPAATIEQKCYAAADAMRQYVRLRDLYTKVFGKIEDANARR